MQNIGKYDIFQIFGKHFVTVSLNDCFHGDFEDETANLFSLFFPAFCCCYGDISVNAL